MHQFPGRLFWQYSHPLPHGSTHTLVHQLSPELVMHFESLACANAGPHHAISLPPDLQGLPAGGPAPASRLGQGSHQRPAVSQAPLVATQSVPAGTSRLSALSQTPYLDPNRLTSSNLGAQEQQRQQQAAYYERAVGSTALRRFSHVSHNPT